MAMLVLSMSCGAASGMTIIQDGDRLFMSGPIGLDDYIKYREATKGKDIRTVILVRSPGGNVRTSLAIADDLIDRKVTTIAAGNCNSACTYLFLAGMKRQFSAKYPIVRTWLGFHGTYAYANQGGTGTGGVLQDVSAYYSRRLGDAYSRDSIAYLALGKLTQSPSGMALVFHPQFRTDIAWCPDGYGPKVVACEKLPGRDAMSEKLITTLELSDIDIPEQLMTPPATEPMMK